MALRERIKSAAEDLGKRAIGRGHEVDFKKLKIDTAKKFGISESEAETEVFRSILLGLDGMVATRGVIDLESDEYRLFKGAVDSIFRSDDRKKFEQFFNDPKIFKAMRLPSRTAQEVIWARGHFGAKFGGRMPAQPILEHVADTSKLFSAVASRISADPRLSSGHGLQFELRGNSDLAADMGALLESIKSIEKAETRFNRELKFDDAMVRLKTEGLASLSKMGENIGDFWEKITESASEAYADERIKNKSRLKKGKETKSPVAAYFKRFIAASILHGTVLGVKELNEMRKIATRLGVAGVAYIRKKTV